VASMGGGGFYAHYGKRVLDLAITCLALIVLSPLLALVALLVRWQLGAPVLFRQRRPGWHGQPFMLFKFRTMTDARDAEGNLLSDSERLTRFGRFLRSTSLDELPELINVLRGEMSLVGPRPLLLRYYPYFTENERVRFGVRPGITGLAQVLGRNDLTWDHRIATDVQYVQTYSLGLDLKIIWLTVWSVLNRRGVQVDPATRMLDFDEERRRRSLDV
jgi:lipopolysaccharide/colanic/teichoic acid biosynthesis glycosyltransferase